MSPYIPQDRRSDLNEQDPPQSVGELTYCMAKLADHYIADKGVSYQTYAEILGSLTALSHELYRRQVGKYEDQKLLEHGDCFRGSMR